MDRQKQDIDVMLATLLGVIKEMSKMLSANIPDAIEQQSAQLARFNQLLKEAKVGATLLNGVGFKEKEILLKSVDQLDRAVTSLNQKNRQIADAKPNIQQNIQDIHHIVTRNRK